MGRVLLQTAGRIPAWGLFRILANISSVNIHDMTCSLVIIFKGVFYSSFANAGIPHVRFEFRLYSLHVHVGWYTSRIVHVHKPNANLLNASNLLGLGKKQIKIIVSLGKIINPLRPSSYDIQKQK